MVVPVTRPPHPNPFARTLRHTTPRFAMAGQKASPPFEVLARGDRLNRSSIGIREPMPKGLGNLPFG